MRRCGTLVGDGPVPCRPGLDQAPLPSHHSQPDSPLSEHPLLTQPSPTEPSPPPTEHSFPLMAMAHPFSALFKPKGNSPGCQQDSSRA